ncbi:hypothetical protein KUTeg_006443 [Tegillarca granosa]|uniref:Estradiol 17-beta-dehydrogenase 2 n=1 Tax=Tegillarca granosa TaxID=220873 RepID=A0ABQ9FGL0_TEGGR|nr:hypothetical protein KUTeg_006443 [Tegillarca granosa]
MADSLNNLFYLTRHISGETVMPTLKSINDHKQTDLYSFILNSILFAYITYALIKWINNKVKMGKRSLIIMAVLGLLTQALKQMEYGIMGAMILAVLAFVCTRVLPAPQLSVQNKAILITGCDSGIGHNLAKYLDSLGFQVFAGCLFKDGPGEQQLREACSNRLVTLQLDVSNTQQVEDAAKTVAIHLNEKKLWGIVNNAGICFIGNVEMMTTEDMQKIMAVNFFGPVNVCKAFLPLLRQGSGRLINIASNTGLAPVPLMGIYCASKSAISTMSEVWRYELKMWGIKVSTIVPSGYKTGILAYDKSSTAERWWKSASDVVRKDYGRDCFEITFKQKSIYTNKQVIH